MKKIYKKIWALVGILIFLWTAFWFFKVEILNEAGIVGNVIKYTIGYILLIPYLIITLAYWLVKRLKKEWKIQK